VTGNAAAAPNFGDVNSPSAPVDIGGLSIFAAQLMGSVYVMPKVELFGRYEFAFIDGLNATTVNTLNPALSNPDPMNLLTVGFNWYLDGQDLKWTTDLGWSITELHPWFADIGAGWRPSEANEIVFRTQLQLIF
jgi:hypothetical protein